MDGNEPIAIRAATAADLPALCGLLEELFAIETDFKAERSRQQRGLQRLLDAGDAARIFVAEVAGSVAAMCTVQVLISTAEGGCVGLMEDVVVGAEWRGCGIGGRLLAGAEEWARERGLTRLQLLADRTNVRALDFYAQQNWQGTRMVALRKHLDS